MKQNDFYEVNGCTEFIPVTINERYNDGVDVTIHGPIRPFRTTVEQVYQFQKPHEPQKVVIPKYVSEWIGYCKANGLTLLGAIEPISKFGEGLADTFTGELNRCLSWVGFNQNAFARAWLDGYEVEEEKLYTVEIPNPNKIGNEVNVLMMNGFRQVIIKKRIW
ncbi:TPA: DUF1642 domain-containing protein [Streptococcus suis]|nr:DUF1642 domain-containing protein [Streptococcus suis]